MRPLYAAKLEDLRLAKGGLPAELVKGHDLVVFIDGKPSNSGAILRAIG